MAFVINVGGVRRMRGGPAPFPWGTGVGARKLSGLGSLGAFVAQKQNKIGRANRGAQLNISRESRWSLKGGADVSFNNMGSKIWDFQEYLEHCNGGDPHPSYGCENRDALMGDRTIQGGYNASQGAFTDAAGQRWKAFFLKNIQFPSGMTVKDLPKVSCAQLAREYLYLRPDCPQDGVPPGPGPSPGPSPGPDGDSSGSSWLWVLLAMGGAAYYVNRKGGKGKKKAPTKKKRKK